MTDLAQVLRETAEEITDFARDNNGPWAEEIYRTNVQIAAALNLLAERIEHAKSA